MNILGRGNWICSLWSVACLGTARTSVVGAQAESFKGKQEKAWEVGGGGWRITALSCINWTQTVCQLTASADKAVTTSDFHWAYETWRTLISRLSSLGFMLRIVGNDANVLSDEMTWLERHFERSLWWRGSQWEPRWLMATANVCTRDVKGPNGSGAK